MTSPENPYQAPLSAQLYERPQGCRREGKVVIVPRDGDLPHRCIKCNAPSVDGLKPTTVSWHHPGWYLLLFINILFYLIAMLVTRKTAKVTAGLCETHKRNRDMRRWVAVGGVLLSALLLIAGSAAADSGEGLKVSGILLMLVSVLFAILFCRSIYAVGINEQEVRLKGFKPLFLESIEP